MCHCSCILQGKATPLYVASQNNHVEVVKLLLEHKAKVDLGRTVSDIF